MTKNVKNWNFATKMIAEIRGRLNAKAIEDGLPVPTDEDVKLEMDRVFSQINGFQIGDSVLRGSTEFWYVDEDSNRLEELPPADRIEILSPFISVPACDLILSQTEPTVEAL